MGVGGGVCIMSDLPVSQEGKGREGKVESGLLVLGGPSAFVTWLHE